MELKKRIKALGLTQQAFAELLGTSQATLARQLNELQGMKAGADVRNFVTALEVLKKHGLLDDFFKAAQESSNKKDMINE